MSPHVGFVQAQPSTCGTDISCSRRTENRCYWLIPSRPWRPCPRLSSAVHSRFLNGRGAWSRDRGTLSRKRSSRHISHRRSGLQPCEACEPPHQDPRLHFEFSIFPFHYTMEKNAGETPGAGRPRTDVGRRGWEKTRESARSQGGLRNRGGTRARCGPRAATCRNKLRAGCLWRSARLDRRSAAKLDCRSRRRSRRPRRGGWGRTR
jgi:hypothetical protein